MSAQPSMIAATDLAAQLPPRRGMSVEFGRYASACLMLIEALGGHPLGAPQEWRKAAVSKLDKRDVATLAPFVTSQPAELPSCLCNLPHRTHAGAAPLEDDLERIAAMPREQLVEQLPANGRWDSVAREPSRWLDGFVRSLRRACQGLDEPWRRASGLLDRETERVGAALARGAERELVACGFPTGVLRMDASKPHGAELGAAVGMVPVLGGPRAAHAWVVEGRLSHIVYPVPGAAQVLDARPPIPAALEALIGMQRARLLRQLDRPLSAGKIAESLITVPSAASHHLAMLERAGLVFRERRGRHVLVHRTVRGTRLLALYE